MKDKWPSSMKNLTLKISSVVLIVGVLCAFLLSLSPKNTSNAYYKSYLRNSLDEGLPDDYFPDYNSIVWDKATGEMPFGSATKVCIFTFEDLEFLTGSEIYGRMVVGKDFINKTTMNSLGYVPSHYGNGYELPYTQSEMRYIVNGRAEGTITSANGWIVVNGDSSALNANIELASSGSKLQNNADFVYVTKNIITGDAILDDGNTVSQDLEKFFSDAKENLVDVNNILGNFEDTGTIDEENIEWGKLVLTGESDYNVFNVNVADLNQIIDLELNVPKDSTVQINVVGDADNQVFNHKINYYASTITDGKTKVQINNPSGEVLNYSSNILWNFENITEINVNTLMMGSILAPDATLTLTGTSTNGTIIVKKAIVNGSGSAISNYTFKGNIPFPPEKASKVIFKKTDLKGNIIAGAKLQIIDAEGNIIDEYISAKDEQYELLNTLIVGEKYTLKEILPPTGYTFAEDIEFTIENKTEEKIIIMKDDVTKVTIKKMDSETDLLLANAKLQILDMKGNVVDEWTTEENLSHIINGKLVAGGKYILHEVQPPDDYDVATDIEFTINKNADVLTIAMYDRYNPKYELPETGGGGITIFQLSGIILIVFGFIIYIRKKEKIK